MTGRWVASVIGIMCLAAALPGCEHKQPATQPSIRQRQDKALQDPMNYKVEPGRGRSDRSKIWELDKEGLKRDWDHVINP